MGVFPPFAPVVHPLFYKSYPLKMVRNYVRKTPLTLFKRKRVRETPRVWHAFTLKTLESASSLHKRLWAVDKERPQSPGGWFNASVSSVKGGELHVCVQARPRARRASVIAYFDLSYGLSEKEKLRHVPLHERTRDPEGMLLKIPVKDEAACLAMHAKAFGWH